MGETDQQNGEETELSLQTKSEDKGKHEIKEKKEKAEAEHRKKAELEAKVRERVSLESKAFDVINRLIEPGITPEYLLEACAFIDHNHYGDIVEERSIAHLCGYPACSNQLGKMPKKKYHISTKTNTVYDITDRKRFCCNQCYRSSHYLEAQIPRTPVWTRRNGDDFMFHLLQTKATGPLEGEEVISSSKMLSLRQEVLQLEKMDQKASKAQKTKVASKEALRESQKLSEELVSLSKEEDSLDTRMKHLSLGNEVAGQVEPVPGKISGAAGGSCLSGARNEGEKNASKNIDSASKVSAEESVGLESALGHLTLQEEEQKTSGSLHVDNEGNSDMTKDCTHSAKSSTKPTDDEETLDISKDFKHHADSSKPGNFAEDSKKPRDSPPSSGETGTSSTSHSETNQKSSNPELRQQLGESKTAYLMRLLNKRQNLFSKVAAVQANTAVDSQASESTKSKAPSAEEKKKFNEEEKAMSFETQGSAHQSDQTTEALSQNVEKRAEQSVTDLESKIPPTKDHDRQKNRPEAKLSPKQPKAASRCLQKASPTKSPQAQVSPLNFVCQIISQWVTPETLNYLGLNSVEGETESPSSDTFHKDPEMQRKYQELCQHLDHQEKDFDDILGREENLDQKEEMNERRPPPDYKELKKQMTEYSHRVEQFLSGPSASRKKKTKQGDGEEDMAESSRTVVLPAIDSHNQLLIRRRIVLERLSCALPSLLSPLGLSVQDISGPLRELVFTFSLTSVNIVLKPAEWTLVSILVLQALAKKSQAVETALRSETRTRSLNMVLSHFGHSSSSLEQLVQETLLEHKVE